MRKVLKRSLAVVMAVAMLFSLIPFTGLRLKASAGTNGHSQAEALQWLNAKIGIQIGNGQCPALARAYYEYLGYSVSGNGKDYENNVPSGWQRTYYYSGYIPQPGDIAVWRATNTALGSTYGHVAIVESASASSMTCYEQGNSAGNKVRKYGYSYGSVTCFIRPDFSGTPIPDLLLKPPRTNPPTMIQEFSYNGRIYRAYASTLTWWQSKQWCEQNGGHLATITQPCDQAAINVFVNKYDNLYLFLGAEHTSGTWKWINGEPLSYTYWGSGQPDYNNNGAEQYLGTYTGGTWNDFTNEGSGAIWGFLYEKDVSNVTNTVSSSLPGVKYSGTKKNGNVFSEYKDAETMGAAGDSMFSNLSFKLYNCSGGISYSVHLSDNGWTSYASNGTLAGTTGQSTAIEAIKIKLTGDAANKYKIYYRTYVNSKGWYAWTSDDQISGTTGAGLHVSAVQTLLVPRVKYSAHVAGVGWTSEVSDGADAGTTGQAKACEGMYAYLADKSFGDIKYMAHIANVGWGINEEIYNGRWAGSTGLELQMEAFRVYLTGEAANRFDVFYQAHCEDYNWMGWVKNGADAGTTGQNKRLEAFEIKVRPKGSSMTDGVPGYNSYAEGALGTKSLTFIANGGTFGYTTVPPCANSEYILPGSVPIKEGYNFAGWYTNSSLTGKKYMPYDYIKMDSDYTLYASWERKSYTVTFNANGGSCSTSSKTVNPNSTYGTLPTPTRTGYTFDGWYTSATGGSKITSSTNVTITSNQTLYAHWTPKTYTVSFDSNGGNCSTSSKTVTYNSTYGTLPTPTRSEYAFDGWFTSATGGSPITSNSSVAITANQTLYAHWTSTHTHRYSTAITKAATCTETGLKTYACSCGDTYTETIPAKGHNFEDWIITVPATSNSEGLKEHTCKRCGIKKTEVIPKISEIKLIIPEKVEMDYKSELYLDRQIINHEHLSYSISWSSSNPDVAEVDSYGNVKALKTGKTVITCTVTDENGKVFEDSCTLKVKYNLLQWILNIFMFYWLWE